MKKSYCDICKEETRSSMLRGLSYQDDIPQFNDKSARFVELELCPDCNGQIVPEIKTIIGNHLKGRKELK